MYSNVALGGGGNVKECFLNEAVFKTRRARGL